MRRISVPIVVAAIGLVVAAAVYARSLDNYFQSDDFDWLYNYGLRAVETGTVHAVLAPPDPAAVEPSNSATWLYRPTTYAMVNLLFRLFGVAAPAGYHAILIAAHLVAAGLAGAIAVRLTRRPVGGFGFGRRVWIALCARGDRGVVWLHRRDSGRGAWAGGGARVPGVA